MANKNLNKLNELSLKYNVTFQPLYTKKAVEKGNLEVVHNALIGGNKYTCLCTYNNAELEELFKNVANGTDNSYIETGYTRKSRNSDKNTILFKGENNEIVYINGTKYNMFDVVKDMDYNRICELIGDYRLNGDEWQMEFANKITEWFKHGGLCLWLEYQYYKSYNETVDEYVENNVKECVGV